MFDKSNPHLYLDLDWLPLSTLRVCNPFCLILASIDHGLWVFRLLLQGEGCPTNAHRPAQTTVTVSCLSISVS